MESNWTAQVKVKWLGNNTPEDWSWLKDWSEVKWAWSTMGEWDMTLWLNVNNPNELEEFVTNKLRSKDWVSDTWSTWVKDVWHQAA